MRFKKGFRKMVVAAVVLLLPAYAIGQGSSVNSYSPYTMYGVGDLSNQGTGNLRAMGGAGTAFRGTHITPYSVSLNYLNPASYSSMPQRSFLINLGFENQNFYLKDSRTKSSYSGINIRDVGILFPLAKRVGFSVSVTPYSSVGYRLEEKVKDENIQGTVGSVTRYYQGDGDMTQFKAGLGMNVTKKLSLGLEMIYYKGYIDRVQEIYFSSEFGESGLTNTYNSISNDISRFSLFAGAQYNAISTQDRVLTFGATYRMGVKLKPKVGHYIPSSNYDPDPTYDKHRTGDFRMANVYSAGFFYYTRNWSVGADYTFADWGSRNSGQTFMSDGKTIKYVNTNTVKAGFQYTPNRYDIRKFFNRLSYRMGVRYEQTYLQFAGKRVDDKAVTLGIGMPLSLTSFSNIDFGVEYGQRGTTRNGLIKENYLKFSISLSILGQDYWFQKKKYN